MTPTRMKLTTLAIGLVTLALAGCASTTPNLDNSFGLAVTAAAAQQTINPEASRNTAVPPGLDGKSAAAAIKQYQETFDKPATDAGATTINIGTGSR